MRRQLLEFLKQRFYLVAGLLVLIVYLIDRSGGQPAIRGFLPPSSQPADVMDSYLTNISSLQYDKTGNLSYRLNAKRMEHLLVSEQTLLSQPIIRYFSIPPP